MKRIHSCKYILGSFQGKFDGSNGAGLLSKDGVLYPTLSYKEGISIHPPVTADDQGEIELLVEWCLQNNLNAPKALQYNSAYKESNIITFWLNNEKLPSPEEATKASGIEISKALIDKVYRRYRSAEVEELEAAEERLDRLCDKLSAEITEWYVQNFVRVRAGGMYSYQTGNAVFFRISSTGYDWTPVIKRYCEDTFGVESNQQIWIGLDEDNRKSDRRYFEGSVKELLFGNLEHEIWASKERGYRKQSDKKGNIDFRA